MSCSITGFTKNLTLAIVLFWGISAGVLYEFAIMQEVYILLSPQKDKVHTFFLRWDMYTSGSTFIKKTNPSSDITLLRHDNTSENQYCKIIALLIIISV